MKRYASIFIGVFLFIIVGNSIYLQIIKEPESPKAKRLPCQKHVTSFERGFGTKDIKIGQKQLENGNFKFTSYIEKSQYAKSKLFNYIKLSDMNIVTTNELKHYIKNEQLSDDKLKITYYIYENDVKNPGKKTKKSKLYAGYVVYKFYNNKNKLIYQSQIDFMNKQGTDIPQSIKCAIKSFATFNN
jgi:hypothetical protein